MRRISTLPNKICSRTPGETIGKDKNRILGNLLNLGNFNMKINKKSGLLGLGLGGITIVYSENAEKLLGTGF